MNKLNSERIEQALQLLEDSGARASEIAALWAMTHDRSVEFRMVLFSMLRQMGFKDVAEQI